MRISTPRELLGKIRYEPTSPWYQVLPSGFLPSSSILNHLAVEPLNLSQVEVSHAAIYVMHGPT